MRPHRPGGRRIQVDPAVAEHVAGDDLVDTAGDGQQAAIGRPLEVRGQQVRENGDTVVGQE